MLLVVATIIGTVFAVFAAAMVGVGVRVLGVSEGDGTLSACWVWVCRWRGGVRT
jgi:hypothetical protein